MKIRKIRIALLIIAAIATVAFCGTVIAFMFRQTEYKNNQFTPADVSCQVKETFNGTQKSSIQIQNTGNINAYLRVRLVSYWVDEDGNVVAKPSEMPAINMASGWVKGSNDTYYCQSTIAPSGLTGNLLSNPITLEEDANGYFQVIEVFAEAIQSEPEKAVTNSWNVTLDTDGNIIAAS